MCIRDRRNKIENQGPRGHRDTKDAEGFGAFLVVVGDEAAGGLLRDACEIGAKEDGSRRGHVGRVGPIVEVPRLLLGRVRPLRGSCHVYSLQSPRAISTSLRTSMRSETRPSTPKSRRERISSASSIVHTCTCNPSR